MSPRPEQLRCETVLDELERFVDGDLAPSEAEAIGRHIEACDGCRAELVWAEAVQRELRSLPTFDAPEHVIERVKASARQSGSAEAPSRWWQLRPSPAWALAAALLLVAVLVPLMTSRQAQEPAVVETAEVEQAAEEVRLALAYVGQYTRRTGEEIRDGLIVDRLVVPAAESLSSLRDTPTRGAQGERNET